GGVVAEAIAGYEASVEERLRQAEVEKAQSQIKALEERKRRRLRLGLATAALAVLALVVGSAYLWHRQQVAREQALDADLRRTAELSDAFDADLDRAAKLRDTARWAEARNALQQAEDRLEEGGTEEQQRHLERARAGLALASELDRIYRDNAVIVDGQFNLRGAEKDYAEAVRTRGLGAVGEDPKAVAARVRASPVRARVLAALEDWAAMTKDPE